METINIKFDKEQLEDIVKKVSENIMKEAKPNFYELSDTAQEKQNEKILVMYLEFNETHSKSDRGRLYFGYAFNTLSKEYASEFYLSYDSDLKKALELKNQGWKEEIV